MYDDVYIGTKVKILQFNEMSNSLFCHSNLDVSLVTYPGPLAPSVNVFNHSLHFIIASSGKFSALALTSVWCLLDTLVGIVLGDLLHLLGRRRVFGRRYPVMISATPGCGCHMSH